MDKSLVTLLRALQTSASFEDAARLLPTATTLLSRLANPLNITLLASQLLSNRVLFAQPSNLQAIRQIFLVFYTAALKHGQDEHSPFAGDLVNKISANAWTKAVLLGADDHSPRWRHTLLIEGILFGFESRQQQVISTDLRAKLESALVTASNLALDSEDTSGHICLLFALKNTFPLLSDYHRSQLHCDQLLPLAIDITFFSMAGLEHGYWLGLIDKDVVETHNKKFNWSIQSPTFVKLADVRSKLLLSPPSSLSRLIAHSVENVRDPGLIIQMLDRVTEFVRNLSLSWRRNKLSEVLAHEEFDFLDAESTKTTLPVLWQFLHETFFAIVIILRAALGRLFSDDILSRDANAPLISMQCLHVLRNLSFISSRLGRNASSQHVFVNMAAIDIITQYPTYADNFLSSIRPAEFGQIPQHPLDRTLDLFFLNTAENFTLCSSPKVMEELILASAMPYVTAGGRNHLVENFEAAHSVVLAVFSVPRNSAITMRYLSSYLDALLSSFPTSLSARQFRLAVRSIVRLIASPSPIASTQPTLQSVILEILHGRTFRASKELLPPGRTEELDKSFSQPMSEEIVLVVTIIDSLCYLDILTLEEWLPLTANLIHCVEDPRQRLQCQQRFWEILSSGDMDVERAAICVGWWNTRGGREMLLFNELPDDDETYMMSGALQNESKL